MGQWYVFNHRNTNRHGYSRQACAEKIYFTEEGNIPQVEITSCGLNNGPLIALGEYEAGIACNLQGKNGIGLIRTLFDKRLPYITQDRVDREENPCQHAANLQDGALVGYKYFSFNGETYQFIVKTRGTGEGRLLVSIVPGGKPLAEVTLTNMSAVWKESVSLLKVPKGMHGLYITFHGKGAVDILSFRFGNVNSELLTGIFIA